MPETQTTASIVVPAYNEERRIPPLLPVLSEAANDLGYEVLVVCNGCTDRTAELVRGFPSLVLLEYSWAGKARALNEADRYLADRFPRLYVDADVRTTSDDLKRLVDALEVTEPIAVRPVETYIPGGATWVVRAWHDARYLIPSSRYWLDHHIEGHHIYGTNKAGRARFDVFPEEGQIMEDAFFDRMFDPSQRIAVEDSRVSVPLPADTRELFRAQTRVWQGNWQLVDWLRVHRPDRLEAGRGMPKTSRGPTEALRYYLHGGSTFPSWRPGDVVPVLVHVVLNAMAKLNARRLIRRGRQADWR